MKEKVYSIGIDVCKATLAICFMAKDLTILKRFNVKNSSQGIEDLKAEIARVKIHPAAYFILESTADYHLLPAILLRENGYKVKVINPIIAKKYSAGSVRKCKTDKIDAKNLAEIGILHKDIHEFKLSRNTVIFKKKVSLLKTLIREKQSLQMAINNCKKTIDQLGGDFEGSYKYLEKTLKQLEKAIKKIENEITSEGKKLKEHKLISNIKGVSDKSASIILSFIADKDFESTQAADGGDRQWRLRQPER